MIEDTINTPDLGAGEIMSPTEKMVPQSKVDEIVRHAYAKAAEKGRNEAFSQMSSQQMQQQQNMQPQQNNHSLGGITPDSLQQMIAQEARKSQEAMMQQARDEALQRDANRVAEEYFQKMEMGASAYDDFKDSIGTLPDLDKIAPIVGFASSLDNTSDIMYELSKNPIKLGSIMQLASISPKHAGEEMRKLSASIKSNAEAKRSEMSNEPLSQIKSSPTKSVDNGSMSVNDFRKIYR